MNLKLVIGNNRIDLSSAIDNESTESFNLVQSFAEAIKLEIYDAVDVESVFLELSGENLQYMRAINTSVKTTYDFGRRQFFSCIWGYCRFKLDVITRDGSCTYYSKFINILFYKEENARNERYKTSVLNMVDFILKNNQRLLSMITKNRHSLVKTDIDTSNFKTIYTEIEILKEIVDCYDKNYVFFKNDLKYRLINEEKIDKFEKLKKVTPKTVKYISRHFEKLEPVDYYTGIRYGDENFKPKKVLTYKKIHDYNIYENQVVLGFIKFIISYIDSRYREIEKENLRLSSNEDDIRNFLFIKYSQYKEELKSVLDSMHRIYIRYSSLMKDLNVGYDFNNLKPTNIFFNNMHYRAVYSIIADWFQKGNYNFDGDSMLVSLTTVDEIYEYYCLLKLIDIVKNTGYELNKSYNYQYQVRDYNCRCNNTFEFVSKDKSSFKITLYYQPVVYSDRFENEISIYRLNGRQNFYTPDFMVKVEDIESKTFKYMIVDSKWQLRKDILNYSLESIINKYAFSLAGDRERNSTIESVFMLQGKDDERRVNNTVYQHVNSELAISQGYLARPNLEIIPLTPEYDYSEYLKEKLEDLLNT